MLKLNADVELIQRFAISNQHACKSDALILRTYKLGEADRIVVFLTRDRGKKRGVAKGARRPKSRYMGALEPLTRGEVAYFEREQRELVQLNYVEPQRSPLSARSGEALGHVGYFAELSTSGPRRRTPTSGCSGWARRWWTRIAGGRPDRAAGALLRILAAAPAGRVSGAGVRRLRGTLLPGR